MSKFEEREKSFEKKFAKDQELQFKVAARSNKYLAEFAGKILNKSDEEKQVYVQELSIRKIVHKLIYYNSHF